MSGFTSIDLSKLPAPEVIKTVEYEVLLAEMKAEAISFMPDLEAYLSLESEPTAQLLRVCAYYRMLDRLEFNDGARACMLALSTGSNLDQLAALFGVTRQVIQEANPNAVPPIPEVLEDDDRLRIRAHLAPEGFPTAGPRGAYIFWALSASGAIKDVSVDAPRFDKLELDPSIAAQLPADVLVLRVVDDAGLDDPMPGDVAVTVLSRDGDGTPSQQDLSAVSTGLNEEDIRPLTDHPRVKPPTIIPYQVEAMLTLYNGPDEGLVLAAAREAIEAYVDEHHRLGHDITISGLHAALHQAGVQNVDLIQPAAHIEVDDYQAAYCTGITLTVGGRDV
ncbi:baseplate assembly protein [Roseobacter sp. HKCCD9010]|uniref:baseplate assembly protein n=1 Tax=unclassified Roseobacter TaxID=196798 RepID=UPI0014929231|nr:MULTISPECIES: baseplate J/gp47 family protein [unclassified Roseobacter]MBF9049884.1 baseplate assembly protein [Rhodobacterales bacterium HKCCD4356]NNV13577.1 baseplate assembly protein [Roseobacter sp. HKCCD7357]NNV16411.1 baseplate assembly protein [Roseobacter sp. HKCCD8768]NNV25870.1 baseplate assembly protein [Roseobacter sp. HKCCD8192]NNV30128.1 baseplate assembly protein [Roseobacter sp. HKCCD9061]